MFMFPFTVEWHQKWWEEGMWGSSFARSLWRWFVSERSATLNWFRLVKSFHSLTQFLYRHIAALCTCIIYHSEKQCQSKNSWQRRSDKESEWKRREKCLKWGQFGSGNFLFHHLKLAFIFNTRGFFKARISNSIF